jgi:hypothetical protein
MGAKDLPEVVSGHFISSGIFCGNPDTFRQWIAPGAIRYR